MNRPLGLLILVAVATLSSVGCPPAPPATSPSASLPRPLPSAQVPVTARADNGLRSRIEQAINVVRARELEASHGFWTIFHGIVGLGPDVMMLDRKSGRRIKALDAIRSGTADMPGLKFEDRGAEGVDVLNATDADRFFAQGHQDQFVAEMAQWGVPLELEFRIGGVTRQFRDFVRYTKLRASIKQKQELGWAILILAEYEGTTLSWTNKYGEALTFEDLIRYEAESPMDAEESVRLGQLPLACGGTHRLFGLSWSLHVHLQRGGKVEGVWKLVQDKTDHWARTAKQLQNPDGSFSTNWFTSRGNAADRGGRLTTTGHTFEWLALALPDEELKAPWMEEAARYLATLILEMQHEAVEGGALYHAIHGLLIYYARVWGPEGLGDNVPYLRLPPHWKQVRRPKSSV
jgi:hypothetical protein